MMAIIIGINIFKFFMAVLFRLEKLMLWVKDYLLDPLKTYFHHFRKFPNYFEHESRNAISRHIMQQFLAKLNSSI
jgi:hypothetical protein